MTHDPHIHVYRKPSAAAKWATIVLGAVLAVCGAILLVGGIWLASLGGSWYYLVAGVGLLLSAFFLFRLSITGVWIYAAVWCGTVLWAFWEVGTDWWAQVPRIVAPTVLLILVLLTIPALLRRPYRPPAETTL
ncbi:hypothetical protein [Rhodobium gokarnense]|uniref:Quinoprotein glucose dehydrogenase n=1 Tax=Rhodobium gokarnense TaxID=364296 RepID=A0ABT3HG58_9HYPH|nr:hypothetical protein [Rhodobium gokarnense]MCW2309365.1 quinoprotein glucose dehydrogenase [Rhodobium gokarnense]